MGATRERTQKGFSETRTVILGAQILLGFQYQAIFESGFGKLPPWAQDSAPVVFALLALSLACMIAPTPFHRLAEHGRATLRLNRFMDGLITFAMLPFALSMGIEVVETAGAPMGPAGASALAAFITAASLAIWFGPALAVRGREDRKQREAREEDMSAKDRIKEMLEETRIVLPGVQALLGFQFAAYLSEGYAKLPPASKFAHTAALPLLLLAMVFLMTPTPFHRIAEGGEPTPMADRVGVGFVLAALPLLSAGLALDFYVLLQKVSGSTGMAAGGAAAVLVGSLVLWFAVPLAARARTLPHDSRSRGAHART